MYNVYNITFLFDKRSGVQGKQIASLKPQLLLLSRRINVSSNNTREGISKKGSLFACRISKEGRLKRKSIPTSQSRTYWKKMFLRIFVPIWPLLRHEHDVQ